MRPLRQTDRPLREAIVALNRRRLSEVEEIPFLRGGPDTETLLARLASDDEVADLPRANAVSTLCSMQFRAADKAALATRDHVAFVRLAVGLLGSEREALRVAAARQLVRFMRLQERLGSQTPEAELVARSLRQVVEAARLPPMCRQGVEWWLERGTIPQRIGPGGRASG